MNPTQQHLFMLLCEFDDICRRNGIDYFLEAGTCLGAVRHKGFIPWDDDVDVAMTEPNYDKFVEACNRELDGTTRRFCDQRTYRDWPTSFGHYIDLTTCRISDLSVFWDGVCGQSIDVFCYMELPGDLKKNVEASNLYFAYDEYINRQFAHYTRKTDAIMDIYHQLLEREKTEGREAVLADLESQIFGHSYPDSQMVMCNSARMHWTTFMPRRPFDYYREAEFEGRKFMVPGDWYEIMLCNYGDDFCMLPKVQEGNHAVMSHANTPCKVYVEDGVSAIDVPTMKADFAAAKEACLEDGYTLSSLRPKGLLAKASIERRRLKRRMAASPKTLQQLMDENTLESARAIDEILGSYATLQLHKSTLYWHVDLGAGPDVDEAVMYQLMVKGNSHKIDIFNGMRLHNGLEATQRMVALQATSRKLRQARKLWHYRQFDEGRKFLEEARKEMPPVRLLDVWELLYDYALAESPQDWEAVLSCATQLLADAPKDSRCLMVKACALCKLDKVEEGREILQSLSKSCDNGFILTDAAAMLETLPSAPQEEVAQ